MIGQMNPYQNPMMMGGHHCNSCHGGGMMGNPMMGGMGGAMGGMMMMSMMMEMMLGLLTQLMGMGSGMNYGGGMMPMGNPSFGGNGGGYPMGSGLGQSTGNFLGAQGSPGTGSSASATPFNAGALNGPIAGEGQGAASVRWALSQEGISESKNPDVVRSYSRGRWEAWCAHFVSTSLEKTGGSPFGHQASVAGILAWGKKNRGHFISTADAKANPGRLKVGDVVVWKQNGMSHVGLLTGVNKDGTFTTIEGNTKDQVAKRTHKFSSNQLTGFVRPRGTY